MHIDSGRPPHTMDVVAVLIIYKMISTIHVDQGTTRSHLNEHGRPVYMNQCSYPLPNDIQLVKGLCPRNNI